METTITSATGNNGSGESKLLLPPLDFSMSNIFSLPPDIFTNAITTNNNNNNNGGGGQSSNNNNAAAAAAFNKNLLSQLSLPPLPDFDSNLFNLSSFPIITSSNNNNKNNTPTIDFSNLPPLPNLPNFNFLSSSSNGGNTDVLKTPASVLGGVPGTSIDNPLPSKVVSYSRPAASKQPQQQGGGGRRGGSAATTAGGRGTKSAAPPVTVQPTKRSGGGGGGKKRTHSIDAEEEDSDFTLDDEDGDGDGDDDDEYRINESSPKRDGGKKQQQQQKKRPQPKKSKKNDNNDTTTEPQQQQPQQIVNGGDTDDHDHATANVDNNNTNTTTNNNAPAIAIDDNTSPLELVMARTGGMLAASGTAAAAAAAAAPPQINTTTTGAAAAAAATIPKNANANVNANATSSLLRVGRQNKFRGVTLHKRSGRYESHIWVKDMGKQVYLGGYSQEEHAAEAYDIAALKVKGRKTKTNFHISKYEDLLNCLDRMTVDELVMAVRRQSQGFSRGSSTYRGVTQHPSGRFEARIGIPGSKHIYLGIHTDEKEAAVCYDRALVRLRGRSAATNFSLTEYKSELADFHLMQGRILNEDQRFLQIHNDPNFFDQWIRLGVAAFPDLEQPRAARQQVQQQQVQQVQQQQVQQQQVQQQVQPHQEQELPMFESLNGDNDDIFGSGGGGIIDDDDAGGAGSKARRGDDDGDEEVDF